MLILDIEPNETKLTFLSKPVVRKNWLQFT